MQMSMRTTRAQLMAVHGLQYFLSMLIVAAGTLNGAMKRKWKGLLFILQHDSWSGYKCSEEVWGGAFILFPSKSPFFFLALLMHVYWHWIAALDWFSN